MSEQDGRVAAEQLAEMWEKAWGVLDDDIGPIPSVRERLLPETLRTLLMVQLVREIRGLRADIGDMRDKGLGVWTLRNDD